MEKVTIKQATQRLNTSRATLYKYLRQCKIKTTKEKNKTYLNIEQLEKIRESINRSKPEKLEKTNLSKTVQTLRKQLERQEKKLEAEKNDNSQLKTENIQLTTRAEVLDEQNKKIIFQMGATAEKMAMITLENKKLIEITGKSGIFKRFFSFWRK